MTRAESDSIDYLDQREPPDEYELMRGCECRWHVSLYHRLRIASWRVTGPIRDALDGIAIRTALALRGRLQYAVVSCHDCQTLGIRDGDGMVHVGGTCSNVHVCRGCLPEYSEAQAENVRYHVQVRSGRLQDREMHHIAAAMDSMFVEWRDLTYSGYYCDLCSYSGPRHMTEREGLAHLRGHFAEDRNLTCTPTDEDIRRSYLMPDSGYQDDVPREWEQ